MCKLVLLKGSDSLLDTYLKVFGLFLTKKKNNSVEENVIECLSVEKGWGGGDGPAM